MKDSKAFDTALALFVTTLSQVVLVSHQLAVFGLQQAFKHGRCDYINQLWDKLTPNMKASFKRYVIATMSHDGTLQTCWLTMKKGKWAINTDVERVVFFRKKNMEDVQLKQPNELIHFDTFHDIDPDKVKDPFSSDDVIKALKRLVANASKEDSLVSSEMKDFLVECEGLAEKINDNTGKTKKAA